MNPQQQQHDQLQQSPYNTKLIECLGVVRSPNGQQQTPPLNTLPQQFQPPPTVQYRTYQLKNHQQMPSTQDFQFFRMQNIPPPLQTSSLISPPLESGPFSGQPYNHFTTTTFLSNERLSMETPAPMPIDCVLGTDTPSPSNHSSSPPLDSSEFLVMALQDDQSGTMRKRKASNESPEKPVQKRHRRTKAEIIAARTEMLKKGLKSCFVNAEKINVTTSETPVRVFQGQHTRMIRENLPRVPRMKFVPKQFLKIDELGFMMTKKGIIYACMTTCSFKTYDCATFCNHLIKFHDMNRQSVGGKKCHSCGLHTPDGSLKNELKHIRDHVLDNSNRAQEILYSKVKSTRQEDSDEDSDAYEDEDDEAVARTPNICETETNVQEETQTSTQEANGQTEATETSKQNEALDDGTEQPLDEETSKALEDALVECDLNGLFDDLQDELSPTLNIRDDPDFDPEREPQSEEEAVPDEAVTSEEENSEDFYSCEGDNEQDGRLTTELSRRTRKIRSDRKRVSRLTMKVLVDQVHGKKSRRQSTLATEVSPKGDKENEDPTTEPVPEAPMPSEACTNNVKNDSESEDEILRPTNRSLQLKKTRIHSTEDESDTKRSSSSSRHSKAKSGISNSTSREDSDESTSSEDIPRRVSPILTRRKARSGSKESASDSTAKSLRGRILNFPARPGSRSSKEPSTSTPAASRRRRKIIPQSNSGSDTEVDDPKAVPEKNETQPEESSSSDENETLRPVKREVKAENSDDWSDEHSKAEDDANFLDKMPIDMVMKIRQSITTRNTNLPKQLGSLVHGTAGKPPETVVQETSKEHLASPVKDSSPETATASPDSNEISSKRPVPDMSKASDILPASPASPLQPMEENNNEPVIGDRDKGQTEKVLTVAEKYKKIEEKIFKIDRRKTRALKQQPTARKSTSRILDDSFPKVGTEAYNNMLESFRVRNFSVELVRLPLEDVNEKEPLKIKIVKGSNGDLPSVEACTTTSQTVFSNEPERSPEVVNSEKFEDNVSPASCPQSSQESESFADLDESLVEIIQPVPDVPYNSQEHNLTLDDTVIDLDSNTTVVESTEVANTSKSKSTAQVQLPQPKDDVCESLKGLYPWVTEDISMKWKKTRSAIKSLMQESSLYSTYKCMSVHCSFFSTDQEAFSAHLDQHRGFDKCFLCSFCLSDELNPEDLIAHYELRHTKDRYQCNQCMYRSTEKFYCDTHQKKYHRNKPKSIYKSPVTVLLKTQRGKSIKKQERKLRDAPATMAKVLKCKFCDCKFFDLQLYCNHLKEDKNHEVKVKTTYEEVGRVRDMMIRDVCEYGLYQCLYCDDGGFNKLDLMKEHLVDSHPHRFALICKTGSKNQLDKRKTGHSSSDIIEIIDVDEAPSHSMKIVDLVDPKQQKDVKVKVFKGNLEDLKSKNGSKTPPMLIASVEANVVM